jgi:hypothetical protein
MVGGARSAVSQATTDLICTSARHAPRRMRDRSVRPNCRPQLAVALWTMVLPTLTCGAS